MKISVIIPTYNRAHFLKRSIESVLNQTYNVSEVIIVDDGSTDNTLEIVNELVLKYPILKYFKTKNSGVSKARNIGVENSAYSWIAFLDSDDEWLPQKIEKQISFLRDNPTVDFVYTDESWFRDLKFVNKKKYQQKTGGNIFLLCLDDCFIGASTVLLKKSLFYECGMFNKDYEVCEDYELWLKITHRNYIGLVPDSLVNKYAGHDDQLSMKYSIMDYWRILALCSTFTSLDLNESESSKIREVVKKKSKILLPGLKKLGLTDHYHTISRELIKLNIS